MERHEQVTMNWSICVRLLNGVIGGNVADGIFNEMKIVVAIFIVC